MAVFKCKMCGANLDIIEGATVCKCDYCGIKQTVPKFMDENMQNLFNRANILRMKGEFDKAERLYEKIVQADSTQSEAYWGLILCKYGIEYVDDPTTFKKIPTCHRASYDSIVADEDYKSALANADFSQRLIYEEQAKEIDRIQKEILALAQKEETYDVFICYKETDANGQRTQDSVIANDIYYQLTNEGFKVFYAAITLEGKLGSAYEPIIFAALNSAKVMLVIGTNPDYFNAVWVKNEWSRFLKIIQKDRSKLLIPCYRDMDAYELPEEFAHLQAQDMSKIGFINDVVRGIKKVVVKDEPKTPTVIKENVTPNVGNNIEPLIKRAFLFCEDGDFDNADEYAEKVLDINPEFAEAYVVKLMIELKLKKQSQLSECKNPIANSPNYKKAVRFATPEYKITLEGYNKTILDRNEALRIEKIYLEAKKLLAVGKFDAAANLFKSISKYKDSTEQISICANRKEEARKADIYSNALSRVQAESANDEAIKKSIAELQTIVGYKEVDKKIELLNKRLEKWYADKIKEKEEAIRRREEEDERRRQAAELAQIAAENRKKKLKKAVKIAISSIIALILILIVVFTFIVPFVRYKKADDFFSKGKLEQAEKIYVELGDYKGCEERIAVIEGIKKIRSGIFNDGIYQILYVGVPIKINYDINGGGFDSSSDESEEYSSVMTFNGVKAPERGGYKFVGWIYHGYSYSIDGVFELNLNAVWSQNEYSIKYKLDGGKLSKLEAISKYYPESETFTLVNPTKAGYTFAGWTGTDLTEPMIEVTIPKGSYENREYTATWKANEYNVTYDANGGTVSLITQKVEYGSNVEYLIPERAGYKFVGWYENDKLCENEKWIRMSDIILVAEWEMCDYTIDYELNGGVNHDDNPITYRIDSNSITLKNPSRTGYNFVGWTFEGQEAPIKDVTIPFGSFGDKCYIANWEAITSTITFNPNGGACASSAMQVKYNQDFTLPIPTWDGHTFSGWYNGDDKLSDGICDFYSNIELIARWDIIKYSISYTMNGEINSNPNQSTYTINDAITLAEPTRTGYEFIGWTYEGQATPIKNVVIKKGTTGDKSFIANWKAITSTITFNANGGTCDSAPLSVTYNESFELPIPTRIGYTFSGWYNDDIEVTSGTCKLYLDTILVAKWSVVKYNISYTMNDGTNPAANLSTYTINDTLTLTEPTRTGYEFIGWTYEGQDMPIKNVVIEKGTTGDKSFIANWKAITSTITFDADGGICDSTSLSVTYNEPFELPTPTRIGYTFAGWYNGNTNVTSGICEIYLDTILVAKWNAIKYNISYKLNGGTNNSSNPTKYTCEDTITLAAPTRKGYTFIGWTFEGQITPIMNVTIAIGTMENKSYTANWQVNSYDITISNGDSVGGIVSGSGAYNYGTSCTVTATPNEGYNFVGWYIGSTCVSTNKNYTFTVADNKNIIVKWEFLYTRDANKITFGYYPQTKVSNETLIAALNSKAGTLPTSSNSQNWTSYGYYIKGSVSNFMWYIDVEQDGAKYRGVYFTSYRPCDPTPNSAGLNRQYDNGYNTKTVYWFKYVPISWTILSENTNDGTALIFCDMIIDAQSYDYDGACSNNYAESTIRNWLNETFYNTAFNELQKQIILTTKVNNCNDKIFLLSYQDVVSLDYTTALKKGLTSYAKAQGGYLKDWWLRSPGSINSESVMHVHSEGGVNNCQPGYFSSSGVVPALWIKIQD